MSGRVAVFLVGGMTLSGGLFGSSWGAPGIVGIRRSVEEEERGREGGGAYAFESRFCGQAGFEVVLAANGRCR